MYLSKGPDCSGGSVEDWLYLHLGPNLGAILIGVLFAVLLAVAIVALNWFADKVSR